MSLRDQLVKAGLASKKDKRRAERKLKNKRKKKQSKRLSKKEVGRRRGEEERKEREAALAARIAQRRERREVEEAAARRLRANQIARHHGMSLPPGPQPFWHRTLEGPLLHRLDLPREIALELRAGRLGVVCSESFGEYDYHVVARTVALRLRDIMAERTLFLNEEPPDPDDPAERLAEPRA